MKVKAKLKNLRISPRKVRASVDNIRGCTVQEAVSKLSSKNRRANDSLIKLLNSAKANAVNNFKLNGDNLRISEIMVGEGLTLKRWRPRAYGRASQILKRSSHIYLTLEEFKVSKEMGDSVKRNKDKGNDKDSEKVVSDNEIRDKSVKSAKDQDKVSDVSKSGHKTAEVKRGKEK